MTATLVTSFGTMNNDPFYCDYRSTVVESRKFGTDITNTYQVAQKNDKNAINNTESNISSSNVQIAKNILVSEASKIKDATKVIDEFRGGAYAREIFQHLIETEKQLDLLAPSDYLFNSNSITPQMRTILIDWLIDVHKYMKLKQETLHLCINILDRYLSLEKHNVTRNIMQLIGCAALWIASKYHEIYPPSISDFTYISAQAFKEKNLVEMEFKILIKIDFKITVATTYDFASHYLSQETDKEILKVIKSLTHYLLEHALVDYNFVGQLPSKIAAVACAYSLLGTRTVTCWDKEMQNTTGYTIGELMPLLNKIEKILNNENATCTSVIKKYQNKKLNKVSCLNFSKINVNSFQ